MLIQQIPLPLTRPMPVRLRNVRRAFHPTPQQGPYRLPHDVKDRLTLALTGFRNREAAFTLATFIARYWSVPGRVTGSFPIDRRALADHDELDLSEGRVRGAIRTLEAVGFLERAIMPSGSRYRATEHGLRRKVILYVFGSEYGTLFLAANNRTRKAQGGDPHVRRSIAPASGSRPSVVKPGAALSYPNAALANSPKSKSEAKPQVIMGQLVKGSGLPAEPSQDSALERALQNLRAGVFGKPRGGNGGGG